MGYQYLYHTTECVTVCKTEKLNCLLMSSVANHPVFNIKRLNWSDIFFQLHIMNRNLLDIIKIDVS